MKHLFLVRHAKSSWANEGASDFERTLNKRGLRDAPLMAQRLGALEIKPDLLLSSSAERARQTAMEISKKLQLEISFQSDLYLASLETLITQVAGLSQEFSNAILVGHNPGLTEFLEYLTEANIENIPTAGIALIRLPIENWTEITADCGELLRFDYPKLHS